MSDKSFFSEGSTAEKEAFSLFIAISNKDIKTFNALWEDHSAWSKEHLVAVVKHLVHEKWVPGLQAILTSYTTDVIYNGLTYEEQSQLLTQWF